MFRFSKIKVTKEKIMVQNTNKNLDVNADYITISKLVEIKTNSKYLIGYLGKAVRPLVLIFPKMNEYVKTW